MRHYRIKDWAKHFENNRTKEMVNMRWVPVPNKHDGEGFSLIMEQPDGLQIYACWHLILQVASKCLRERGTLLREDGTPHNAESIARKCRCSDYKAMQRALDFCSSSQVSWLEVVGKEGAEIPQEGAGCLRGREGKGREGKGIASSGSEFDQSIPKDLQDERFKKEWHSYVNDRRARRRAITADSSGKILFALHRIGLEKSLRWLDGAIQAGWNSVFDPDDNKKRKEPEPIKAGGIKISDIQ